MIYPDADLVEHIQRVDVVLCEKDNGSTLAAGKIGEAIEEFKQALLISPDDVDIHNDLGSIYGNAQRYGEAISEFKKAKQGNPQDIKAYRNLASVYYRQAAVELAKDECRKRLEVFPQDTYLRKMLAVLGDSHKKD